MRILSIVFWGLLVTAVVNPPLAGVCGWLILLVAGLTTLYLDNCPR